MNINDLRPASEFAQNFGVKMAVYGGPGEGKTPITINTSPRPLLLVSEPGLLSARKSTIPTWPAFSYPKHEEFFEWFTRSREADNFDTLIWDSSSQSAEIVVDDCLTGKTKNGNKRHGQEAYGEMATSVMGWLNKLYFMPRKHIVLICKRESVELSGVMYNRPYFPGKVLPTRVPHLVDIIAYLGNHAVPGVVPSPTKAFRCRHSYDTMARTRFDTIAEFEPPDISQIIAKAMS
jgi:hypothetical protein